MKNRKSLTLLLSVVLVLVLTASVLVACDPKQKDPVPPGPEGGTYYFDAGTAEYTVTLEADSKFTLNIAGDTRYGTYSLSGNALLLTFDDGAEPLSAKLTNYYNNLDLTYNGQAYTFLRKTEFTVTFATGEGATQLDPVTVLNGKTISKPNSPTKDGNFVFEGWYTDENFQYKYNFDAPVTEDITLYANFVSSIREPIEFAVKFAGEGTSEFEAVQTIKGVAYDLPEPKKDEDKFVGWWISSSNEQDKLSYKYEGQKLTENTTFFPMWQSQLVDGLEVSFTNEGVFWTGASDVTISVVAPSEKTQELTGKNGSYKFGANTYELSENGVYTVTVKAAGSDKSTVRYFVNGRLSRVSCFEVENNSVKFNHVANAQSYNVTIAAKDGVKTETLDASTVQNSTMVFDFSAYDIPADGYVFTVVAKADAYLDSTSDPFKFNRILDKVAAPVFDEATQSYSWQTVANATRYVVKLNGEQVLDGQATSLDLKYKDPGEYKLEVQPFGFGYNTPGATTATLNKQKLAVPANLSANSDGKSISWDSVAGNSGYIVYNGETVLDEPTTNSYTIDPNKVGSAALNLSVVAKSSNAQNNSPKSDVLSISNKLESVAYEKGVISWNLVFGTDTYYVKINDGQELEVVGALSTDKLPLVAKTNTITVRTQSGESKSITVDAYEIAFDLGYEGGVQDSLYKTAGDVLTLSPPANRLGYDFVNWTDSNGADVFDGEFNFASDVTFVAKWTAHVFDIVFDLADKATDAENQAAKYQNQTVTFDSADFTLPVPQSASKDNKYAFEGWYLGTSSNSQKIADYSGKAVGPFTFDPSDGKVTLYANWVALFKFEEAEGGWRVMKNGANIDYLSEVTVPAQQDGEWVVAISDFSGCLNLKTLNIPSSIKQINFGTQGVSFAGDSALTAINVYQAEGYNDVAKYSGIDGVLFANDAQGNAVQLMYCPLGKLSDMTEYTVPSGTKTIAAGAFYSEKYQYNAFHMQTINFPATVERIEKNAFYNIVNIETINFLSVQEGEKEAEGLVIESGAFTGDGDKTHSSAYDVIVINLPKRYSATSFDLFSEFQWLEQINIETGGSLESVDGVLCKKSGTTLELVAYPLGGERTYSVPTGVTKIGAKAFYHNTRIKDVTIGAHVTDIGESAFEGCMGLTTLKFLGTKESSDLRIAKKAFYGYYKNNPSSALWPSVTELTLPANLVELGEMAFGNHGRLKEVKVLVEREKVDFKANAFVDIEVNKTAWVTDVYLGAGVPEFNIASVFGGAVQRVEVDPQNKYFITDENDGTNRGALYNQDMTKLLFFPKSFEGVFNIPLKITSIAESLFSGCNMTVVKIHNNVTNIGDLAFDDCAKLNSVEFCNQSYEPLQAGETFAALEIGVNAFKDCKQLTAISLPEGLTKLNEGVFSGCTQLVSVHLPATLKEMALKSAGSAEEGEVGDFTMFEKCNALSELTVAEGNENYGAYDDILYSLRKVTKNGAEEYVEDTLLFCSRGKTGAVTIPSTVRRVQANSFSGSKVSEIIFKDLEETTNVGEADNVDLVIMAGALYNTPQLERLHLPEGMTRLDQMIFYNSILLYEEAFDTLEIPASMEFIGSRLFKGYFHWNSPLTVTFAEAKEGQDVKGLEIENAVESNSLFVTASAGSHGETNRTIIPIAPITFPSHLVHLGDEALYQTKVGSVKFTEPAKNEDGSYKHSLTIGKKAFYDAKNLTELTLPANLTSIGDYAFYHCAFSSVNIPANVTTIGMHAFIGSTTGSVASQSSHLTQLTFAEGSKLKTIGESAFASQSLSQVTIPASVTEIGKLAFSVNTLLSNITFEDFDKAMTASEEEVKIDDILLTIGDNAFAADSALSTITLPARLKSLGANAFLNSGLTSIEFAGEKDSDSVDTQTQSPDYEEDRSFSHLESIGDMAFNNTPLQSIAFPRTISSGTTNELKLGSNLFLGCLKLTEVTLSSTVLDISNVFAGNGTIKKINVNVNNEKYMADDNGLPFIYEKNQGSADMSIVLVYADVDENLTLSGTKVGAGALTNITGIKHVTIAASVVDIGARAFENCVSLETVTIEPGSRLQTVEAYAFQNCISLTSVDFSNAVQLATFGDGAYPTSGAYSDPKKTADCKGVFNGCSKLQKVTLGSGVETLGKAMFAGSGVVTVDMSKATALEELSDFVFANTPNLTNLILPATNNKIKHLGAYAFYGSGVQELDLSSCTNLKATAPSIELAEDPFGKDSKKKGIDEGTSQYAATFAYATSLKTVTFPTTLQAIGQYTFRGCSALTTVNGIDKVSLFCAYCFAELGDLKLTLGDLDVTFGQYVFYKSGAVQITPPANHTMTFGNSYAFAESKIKEWTIRTQDVYTKTDYMFNKCTELEHVYVTKGATDNFTTIGSSMFEGCTSLVSVEFDKLENLTSIGGSAFNMYNSSTKEPYENAFIGQLVDGKSVLDLSKTKITTIGAQAFSCCNKLTAVKLPATLEKIGTGTENANNKYVGAFYSCSLLESIDFSLCKSLTLIGKLAFEECTSLKNVDLSTTIIEKVYQETFMNCTSLQSVKLPNTVTTFDSTSQFQGCTSLESIDLSKTSITSFPYNKSLALTTGATTFKGCSALQTVKLPASLTGIGREAFMDCTMLTSVIVANANGEPVASNVSIIANSAFQGCSSLTSFDLSAATKIGTSAFAGAGFTTLTLPDKSFAASSISANAFDGCAKLTTVIIPAQFSVATNVANYMFQNCTALESVVFQEGEGAKTRTLPKGMFAGCTQLGSIDFTNAYITSVPAEFLKGASELKSITLPETVTTISANAFENCTSLNEVNLEKVKTIGAAAFKNCALTTLTLEELTTLSADSFLGNGLTSVTLSGNAASKFAFDDTFKSFTNTAGTTTYTYNPTLSENGVLDLSQVENLALSAYMFQGIKGLKSVILPELPKNYMYVFSQIPAYTFANSSVETVDISKSKVDYIGEGAFKNSKLKTIDLSGVQFILKSAFEGTQLESLIIPSSVSTIGEGAFANCSKLRSVKIDDHNAQLDLQSPASAGTSDYPKANNTKLGVFENDPITSLTLGNRVKTIPRNAFANTTEYPDVQNGAEFDLTYVTRIEDYAFFGSLAGTVVLGENLTYIGAAAFANTAMLTSLTFGNAEDSEVQFKMNGYGTANETKTDINYFGVFEASALSSVVGMPKFVNENTKAAEIGSRMFKDCPNLTTIELNKAPTAIADFAFKNTALESISLDGVTTIGKNAFFGTKLITLNIPATVTSLGAGAFAFAPLTDVTFAEGDDEITSTDGGKSTPTRTPSTGMVGEYDQSKHTSYGVFDNCTSLASVTLSSRVKTIGASMFYYCTSLTKINLPEGVTVGDCAFAFSGLTSVDLTNVSTLNSSAFCATKITELELPVSVTLSSTSQFTDCDELKTVTFTNKDNVTLPTTQNYNQTFKFCDKLNTVTICEGVTMLSQTFIDCENLENVTLPDSLTSLSSSVFKNCIGLKKLVIPLMLTSFTIGGTSDTFAGCGKDLHIYFMAERSSVYALTYKVTKNTQGVITGTSSPLVLLEEQCTVSYGYDPQAEGQSSTSESGTQALMQTAMSNVAYAENEH